MLCMKEGGSKETVYFGAFFPSLLYSNIEGQKTTFIFSEFQNLLFLHSSTKSESPPNIVEGLWNRDAEKQKKGPTASFGSESLAELCELLCCYAGLHIFGHSNGDRLVTFGDLFGDSRRFFCNLSTALRLPEYGDRPSEDGASLPPVPCGWR